MDGSTQEQREQQVAQLKAQQLLEAVHSALLNGRYVVVDCFEGPFTSFITTRFGGNSMAPFDTLNMAYHVGDNPLAVAYNRQLVRNDFGFDHLCFMDQSHTNKVMVVDENNVEQEVFPCDGIVTKLKGVALAVMTADCLPLLLCDEEKQVVGAIHCGWRGIASGIIANAIDKMEELGARRDRIIAYMGPAIGPRSFVVGDDVRDVFIQQYEPFAEAFVDRVVVNPNFTMTASPVASSAFSIEGTTAVLLGRLARTLNAQSSMAKAAAVVAAEKASKEAATEAAQGNSASHGSSTTFDASYKGSAVAINANAQHPAVDDLKANVAQSGALEQGPVPADACRNVVDPELKATVAAQQSDKSAASAEASASSDAQAEATKPTARDFLVAEGTLPRSEILDSEEDLAMMERIKRVQVPGAFNENTVLEVLHDPELGEIKLLRLEGKHLCNIYELVVLALQRAGATGFVYGGRFDTFAQSTLFYSYRKSNRTGRMASIISINR